MSDVTDAGGKLADGGSDEKPQPTRSKKRGRPKSVLIESTCKTCGEKTMLSSQSLECKKCNRKFRTARRKFLRESARPPREHGDEKGDDEEKEASKKAAEGSDGSDGAEKAKAPLPVPLNPAMPNKVPYFPVWYKPSPMRVQGPAFLSMATVDKAAGGAGVAGQPPALLQSPLGPPMPMFTPGLRVPPSAQAKGSSEEASEEAIDASLPIASASEDGLRALGHDTRPMLAEEEAEEVVEPGQGSVHVRVGKQALKPSRPMVGKQRDGSGTRELSGATRTKVVQLTDTLILSTEPDDEEAHSADA